MKLEATFCFVDLAGFSALTEAHGNDAAADLGLRFKRLVSETLSSEGRVLKTVGDAVLVALPEPRPGLEFLRKLWTKSVEEHGFLVLRAGLHHGEAVEREGEVFGGAVNLAARIAAQARGGEVLASRDVARVARSAGVNMRELGEVKLHNIAQPVALFSLQLGSDPVQPVVDPVCRMRVQPDFAAGRLVADGVSYWFCSLECAASFAQHPQAYVASPKG